MRKVTLTSKVLLSWILLFPMLQGGELRAQQTEQPKDILTLTLEQALNIALAENPTIKVANEDIALKKVADTEAWQNLLPTADITGSWQHTLKAAEMKLGDNTFKMGIDGSNTVAGVLNVNLPLFAPTVYATMKLTKRDIELSVEKARDSKQSLVNQVTKAFFQLILAQDSYAVLQESYKVAEENFNVVNEKFKQGSVSEFDKITAEVQMKSVLPNVISGRNAVNIAKLQLKVLMGVTAEVDIRIDDKLSNYETSLFANELNKLNEGLYNNTTLRQLDLNKSMLEQSLKMAKTSFLPTLGANFSYQYQSLYNTSWNVFNYNWAGSSAIAFSLSIPLYKASNFTKLKSTRIQLRQLADTRLDTERKLTMQADTYRNNMEASSEQVASNKENVAQARKAVAIATKRYDVGAGTVLELNNSQVSLTQAELVYCQSIFEYLSAKADLDQVLGNDYVAK